MIGYTSWHQLVITVVLLVFYLHAFSCNCYSVVCLSCYLVSLWLMLFSYLMTAVYLVIILCTLFTCTSSPLYTHTHQVAFWRPWISMSRYWTLCFHCSGIRWDRTLREELELLPIRFWYSYLSCLHIISWFLLYQIQLLFQSLFIWYHAWMLICDIAVIMIYYSWDL